MSWKTPNMAALRETVAPISDALKKAADAQQQDGKRRIVAMAEAVAGRKLTEAELSRVNGEERPGCIALTCEQLRRKGGSLSPDAEAERAKLD